MRKIKEILRLHFEHQQGSRAIARACQVSPTTVSDYIAKAQQSGLDAQRIGALSDEVLHRLFFPEVPMPSPKKAALDFPAMQKELQKKAVTLQLLWEGYRAVHPEGYGRSQFFQYYRDFARTLHPLMRLEHKAGEKLFVDFSGDRPSYVDKATGEVITAELFVAALGAGSRTFAVAVTEQKIPSWIKAHILAFENYGGLPAIVVPDYVPANIIRNHAMGNGAEITKGTDVGADPIGQALGPGRLGKGQVTVAHDPHEDLGFTDLAR